MDGVDSETPAGIPAITPQLGSYSVVDEQDRQAGVTGVRFASPLEL